MNTKHLYILTVLLSVSTITKGQSYESLRNDISAILATKKATVGVSIMRDDGSDTLSINGDHHFPMQSVFKFHIALTTLSLIDQGKFALDQLITIHKNELLPGLYSPLREKYPQGATLKISEILEYTVSLSDNVGCDALLRLIGGPQVVENYIVEKGFNNFSVKINEEVMQNNWDMQFQNWTTPNTSTQVLSVFYKNDKKFLSPHLHEFIWKTMQQTETGKNRLKGKLPEGTIVAHKTGWSGTNKEGITAAVNDIGIIFLPNGRYFFISVFVTDSTEDGATNELIIAELARLTWDYFTERTK